MPGIGCVILARGVAEPEKDHGDLELEAFAVEKVPNFIRVFLGLSKDEDSASFHLHLD
jgi:hypothetical protein